MKTIFSICLMIMLSFCTFAEARQFGVSVHIIEKRSEIPPVEVIAIDNRIKVMNAPVGSKLEIYSVVGIKVAEIEITQPSGEYMVNIAKGYYIVRIGETVRKIAIR